MTEPTFPPSGFPPSPGPPKRDYGRETYILTVAAIGIAVVTAVVALLAWVYPFQAVIPSPLQAPSPASATPSGPGPDGSTPSGPPEEATTTPPVDPLPAPEPTPSAGVQETVGPPEPQEGEKEPQIAQATPPSPPARKRLRRRQDPQVEPLFGSPASEEPVSPVVESQQPPPAQTPSGGGQPAADDPQISVGEQLNVTAEADPIIEYTDPQGPQLLRCNALPKLPSDPLRSLADGKQLVVHAWVTTDGKGRIDFLDAAWMPAPLRQRIQADLERCLWKPRKDRRGELVNSEAEVIFTWGRR